MAKKEREKRKPRSRPNAKKSPDQDDAPRERSKPKSKKRPEKEANVEPEKNVPPVPDKITCECGFRFKKMVEETYGSFICPKCSKATSLEVQEKLFLNTKNITVMVVAFVLCFVLYFGIEIVMGKLNENKPTTLKLMNDDKLPILEIFPSED